MSEPAASDEHRLTCRQEDVDRDRVNLRCSCGAQWRTNCHPPALSWRIASGWWERHIHEAIRDEKWGHVRRLGSLGWTLMTLESDKRIGPHLTDEDKELCQRLAERLGIVYVQVKDEVQSA